MEKRSIDELLPPIDPLIQTIEKVILCVQGSYVSLKKRPETLRDPDAKSMKLEDAIKKRKEDLKYYMRLLTSCQNSMKTKLQISQSEIITKMDDIDNQIMNMDQILHSLTDQSTLNECIQNLSSKVNNYKKNIPVLDEKIIKAKKQLKSHDQMESEYRSYLSKIEQLKQKKKQISQEMDQMANRKVEFGKIEIKIPSNKPNLKMKKALNNSISKLRILIANVDREITDTEKQKNEMRSIIKESQNQYINLKKCVNETISKTTKKTHFITNVVDEMKKLIYIRKDRSELKKEMNRERQHLFDFQGEIDRVNSKIRLLKSKKQKLINEECLIEEQFLQKAMPKKKEKRRKRKNNKLIFLNNNELEYSNDETNDDKTDHELIINRRKDIKEKQKNNLELLKLVENTNADIISLRQRIREVQENIIFQAKLKKEKESLKKDRENHSIFFSFEKIQNQIEEKKANIENLKKKIQEKKEFLSLYSQLESIKDDSDF